MSFENYFPLWNDLNTAQKKVISDNLITRDVKKGTIIHNGNLDCTGLLLVKSGRKMLCTLSLNLPSFLKITQVAAGMVYSYIPSGTGLSVDTAM